MLMATDLHRCLGPGAARPRCRHRAPTNWQAKLLRERPKRCLMLLFEPPEREDRSRNPPCSA